MRVEDMRVHWSFCTGSSPRIGYREPDCPVRTVTHTFNFQSPEMFEAKAREIVSQWVPTLAGKSFHVQNAAQRIQAVFPAWKRSGFSMSTFWRRWKTGTGSHHIHGSDYVIAVVTIGTQAGFSLWTREELRRFALLNRTDTAEFGI
jgi:hypothetical protein